MSSLLVLIPLLLTAVSSAAPPIDTHAGGKLKDLGLPGFGDELVLVKGGTFTMGSSTDEEYHDDAELQHEVTLSSFAIARTEVSQQLWVAVMGENPSATENDGFTEIGDALPVQQLTWCAATEFANRLSTLNSLTPVYTGVEACMLSNGSSVHWVKGANGYRLPTEAEWEYAARGGTTNMYGPAKSAKDVCRYGNIGDASAHVFGWSEPLLFTCNDGNPAPSAVGSYRRNRYGVYDTLGNVWEWVWDWYEPYTDAPAIDPTGPLRGSTRVDRGGTWGGSTVKTARVARRDATSPDSAYDIVGLRLARSVP